MQKRSGIYAKEVWFVPEPAACELKELEEKRRLGSGPKQRPSLSK
jgi:hypothetical protein